MVTIIGGGLAGCEAAWQAATSMCRSSSTRCGRSVPTAVHKTDRTRGARLQQFLPRRQARQRGRPSQGRDAAARLAHHARGRSCRACRPAPRWPSTAIASPKAVTRRDREPSAHPHRARARSRACPPAPAVAVIVATGPLTSDALSRRHRRVSSAPTTLAFFDAISPIVLAESIDMSKVFRASRWGRSFRVTAASRRDELARRMSRDAGRRRDAVRRSVRCRRWRRRLSELSVHAATSTQRSTTRSSPPRRRRCTSSTTRSSSRAACRSR